jgi:hypothetical protein
VIEAKSNNETTTTNMNFKLTTAVLLALASVPTSQSRTRLFRGRHHNRPHNPKPAALQQQQFQQEQQHQQKQQNAGRTGPYGPQDDAGQQGGMGVGLQQEQEQEQEKEQEHMHMQEQAQDQDQEHMIEQEREQYGHNHDFNNTNNGGQQGQQLQFRDGSCSGNGNSTWLHEEGECPFYGRFPVADNLNAKLCNIACLTKCGLAGIEVCRTVDETAESFTLCLRPERTNQNWDTCSPCTD